MWVLGWVGVRGPWLFCFVFFCWLTREATTSEDTKVGLLGIQAGEGLRDPN